MVPTLIYCASKNRRYDEIAVQYGFKIGARLPTTVYYPLFFADQNWKKPDRKKYMTELEKHRPVMATVLDWERWDQYQEVLDWAEEVAQFVEKIVVVPKVCDSVSLIPETVGGKEVVLGYSIPTRYGATTVPVREFVGRSVHLLGGTPHAQLKLADILDITSCDGNVICRMASSWCAYWVPGTFQYSRKSDWYWPRVNEADGWMAGKDVTYEAFRRSCFNVTSAWRQREEIT